MRGDRRGGGGAAAAGALVMMSVMAALLPAPAAAAAACGDDGRCECRASRSAAWHARSGRFDPASGRDLRNYPPDPVVEYRRLDLRVTIRDMHERVMEGTCEHTVWPVAGPVEELRLGAGPSPSMTIQDVRVLGAEGDGADEGTVVTFVHEGEWLVMRFEPALAAGREWRVEIEYVVEDAPEGLEWTVESAAWPGRAAQVHTQGQPESNHYWFPCHDSPNVRMSQRVEARVPKGYVASSNGVLAERGEEGDLERFVWEIERPGTHVPYLASLVVGKFEVVEVSRPRCGTALEVYVAPGMGRLVEGTYGRTGAMVDYFAGWTGRGYPWGRYAQLVVHNFGAGGMENTGATTMHEWALYDDAALRDGDLDDLIAHELAHQWFGDLITCNSWEHIWLNEGFATFATHLWEGERRGEGAFLARMHGEREGVIAADRSDPAPAPERPGMCSKVYGHPWEVFMREANPYGKGALVLHALREKVGRGVFDAGVRRYVERFAGRTVETGDFRRVMEEASGRSLERFFAQWCYRPGVPRVRVEHRWEAAERALVVTAEQVQPIDGDNPAFAVTIPVWVRTGATPGWMEIEVEFDTRKAERRVVLAEAPTMIVVDPRCTVPGRIERVGVSVAEWGRVLIEGPTSASRLDAAAALGRAGPGERAAARAALVAVLAREDEAVWARSAAAAGLGALGDAEAGEALARAIEAGIGDARVRLAALRAVGAGMAERRDAAGGDATAGMARRVWARDESFACRAEALRLLSRVEGERAMPELVAGLRVDSHRDVVRIAAIETLAEIDRPECLEPVVAMAAEGHWPRTRGAALKAAGRLARHDFGRVLSVLTAAMTEREDRPRLAAAEALASLGDARGRGALVAGTTDASGSFRGAARRWLAVLDASLALRAADAAAAPAAPVREPERVPARPRVHPGWMAPGEAVGSGGR